MVCIISIGLDTCRVALYLLVVIILLAPILLIKEHIHILNILLLVLLVWRILEIIVDLLLRRWLWSLLADWVTHVTAVVVLSPIITGWATVILLDFLVNWGKWRQLGGVHLLLLGLSIIKLLLLLLGVLLLNGIDILLLVSLLLRGLLLLFNLLMLLMLWCIIMMLMLLLLLLLLLVVHGVKVVNDTTHTHHLLAFRHKLNCCLW